MARHQGTFYDVEGEFAWLLSSTRLVSIEIDGEIGIIRFFGQARSREGLFWYETTTQRMEMPSEQASRLALTFDLLYAAGQSDTASRIRTILEIK